MKISKELSSTLMLANFYCTILVVMIHYNSLYHYKIPEPTEIFYLIQIYFNISLTRIAVPFFALTSGFFLYLNFFLTFYNYKNSIKRRIKTLIIPYLTVSIIVFTFNRIIDFSNSIPVNYSAVKLMEIITTPETIQLWYIRDLFFLVTVSPIIYLLYKHVPYIYITVISIMWMIDFQPFPKLGGWHFITIETLYFFSLGCIAAFKKEKISVLFNNLSKNTTYTFFCIYLATSFVRVYLTLNYFHQLDSWQYTLSNIFHKISIMIGIFLVITLSNKNKTKLFLKLSELTFFVYLYHLLPLSKFILLFWNNFIPDIYLFYFTTPTSLFISFGFAYYLKYSFPKLYQFLTGGR